MPILLEKSLPATEEAFAGLVETVSTMAGEQELPPSIAYHLDLVIEEMVSNVVRYGFPEGNGDSGHIDVRIERADRDLVVTVADDGVPFNPLESAPPQLDLALEDRPIGGLGIHMVREVARDIHYARERDRNRLVVTLATH